MNNIFVKPNSPFYRFARIINLGHIEKDVFLVYMKKTLISADVNVSDEFLNSILDFTNGHPFYTQLFLQQLVISNLIGERNISFENLLNNILLLEKNYLESLWDKVSFSKEQAKVVIELAKRTKSLYRYLNHRKINIPRVLNKLLGSGTVLKHGQNYFLSDPLFEYWIKKYIIN